MTRQNEPWLETTIHDCGVHARARHVSINATERSDGLALSCRIVLEASTGKSRRPAQTGHSGLLFRERSPIMPPFRANEVAPCRRKLKREQRPINGNWTKN